jgi:uncharacterized protein (TIGR02599 family)
MSLLSHPRFDGRSRRGFTLVEILVSLAVLAVLLLVSANVIGQVQRTWSASAARVAQFREARVAFDIITKSLSQATLNTYLDYDNNYLQNPAAVGGGVAVNYQRRSELRFVSGPAATLVTGGGGEGSIQPGQAVFFQAPLGVVRNAANSGLESLLCGRGYFVQLSTDDAFRPPFVTQQRVRYRLMEFSPPTEDNLIYTEAQDPSRARSVGVWFASAGAALAAGETEATRGVTRPIADNIVLMLISPRTEPLVGGGAGAGGAAADPLAIAPEYWYDSLQAPSGSTQGFQHQLPPLVRVVLVAIDEASAQRLEAQNGGTGMPDLLSDSGASFTNARSMEGDLQDFTNYLVERNVNFRVFSATVPILSSKWSS